MPVELLPFSEAALGGVTDEEAAMTTARIMWPCGSGPVPLRAAAEQRLTAIRLIDALGRRAVGAFEVPNYALRGWPHTLDSRDHPSWRAPPSTSGTRSY